jgi:hypothetical protein
LQCWAIEWTEKSLVRSTNYIALGRQVIRISIGYAFVAFLFPGLATVCTVAGCSSKSEFAVAPVHGIVTMAGHPMTGGKVAFAPIAQAAGQIAGKAAIGLIQPDGQYVLMTYEDGDGAIVGEHWVTVFVPDTTPQPPPEPGEDPSTTPTYKRRAVPQKQVVVAGQDNEINIVL